MVRLALARANSKRPMKSRTLIAHIAHIRASRQKVRRLTIRNIPLGHGLHVRRAQRLARPDIRIRIQRLNAHLAPRSKRRAFKAPLHSLPEGLRARARVATHVVLHRAVSGRDVGAFPGGAKHAVNALVGADLLAQHADGVVGQADGVEGVDAVPGGDSGVGLAAGEVHAHLDIGEHADVGHAVNRGGEFVARAGVDHEAGGGAFVGAGGDELELAAAAFFGGCAKETDTAGKFGFAESAGNGEEGGEGGGGNEVVAAGVADAGEGVVLGVEGDEASAGAELAGEGGIEAVRTGGNLEAELLEGGDEGVVGLVLLVCQLGVGVNLLVDGGELSFAGIDLGNDDFAPVLVLDKILHGGWWGPGGPQRKELAMLGIGLHIGMNIKAAVFLGAVREQPPGPREGREEARLYTPRRTSKALEVQCLEFCSADGSKAIL